MNFNARGQYENILVQLTTTNIHIHSSVYESCTNLNLHFKVPHKIIGRIHECISSSFKVDIPNKSKQNKTKNSILSIQTYSIHTYTHTREDEMLAMFLFLLNADFQLLKSYVTLYVLSRFSNKINIAQFIFLGVQ